MKKAIVIGGSGFLGSEILSQLSEKKVESLVVVNKNQPELQSNQKAVTGGIKAITTSLIDEFKPDVIFHCARPTLPRFKRFGRSIAAGKAYRLNNELIANIKRANHKPKLVFASGSLMYGSSFKTHDESSPVKPISYARQYFKGELPLLEAIKYNDFPVFVLRFPWLLGNGSWFKWFYLENIRKHNATPVFGDGNNQMVILDIQDAAKLMFLYAEKFNLSGIYNIFSERSLTQTEFALAIKNAFGSEIKDYRSIFPKRIEKEAIEAFTSTILLKSKYNDILNDFKFISLEESLKRIKKEDAKT